MGSGPFVDSPFHAKLDLRVDPKNSLHGYIEPDAPMPVADYQQAIADTRDQWVAI